MSKIKEVLYEEIDDSIYTKNDVANFYWYYNAIRYKFTIYGRT